MTVDSSNEQDIFPRSPAELVSFGIAASILSIIVGLVVYIWITNKNQPPILSVKTDPEIRQEQGQFYVPFSVTNTGDETAELVTVDAELSVEGEPEETASVEVDYLSHQETQSGAFVFKNDPNRGKLEVKVSSYKLP
jgi:uncharacterized protein (TIGR02588 family)